VKRRHDRVHSSYVEDRQSAIDRLNRFAYPRRERGAVTGRCANYKDRARRGAAFHLVHGVVDRRRHRRIKRLQMDITGDSDDG
jgi:hypothetical protein